jgi:hypothetical protein
MNLQKSFYSVYRVDNLMIIFFWKGEKLAFCVLFSFLLELLEA